MGDLSWMQSLSSLVCLAVSTVSHCTKGRDQTQDDKSISISSSFCSVTYGFSSGHSLDHPDTLLHLNYVVPWESVPSLDLQMTQKTGFFSTTNQVNTSNPDLQGYQG